MKLGDKMSILFLNTVYRVQDMQMMMAKPETTNDVVFWWIYSGFVVDLPIENDDLMGF